MENQNETPGQSAIKKLIEENEFLIKATKSNGFFHLYFDLLKSGISNTKAFNKLNDRFYSSVGEYRYSSYNSFRHQLRKFLIHDNLKRDK